MRTLPRALALLCIPVLVIAGCSTDHTQWPGATSEPCGIVTNGTPIAKTAMAGATTERNISANPEVATGYRKGMSAVRTASYAVATANPLSTQAACRVLRDGGSATDALITAQAVLGLVEPQSSGIGGGGFLVYFDAATGAVEAYDGREVAPAAATENYLRWIDDAHPVEPAPDTRSSGRSIGVPGILRMLHDAHTAHGARPWHDLFTPAVQLADDGFEISPRLAAAIADSAAGLAVDQEAGTYFLNPDGSARPAGTKLTNPAYAKTLGAIATDGPDAFYRGAIAQNIVAAATDTSAGRTPSLMTTADLSDYTAKRRESLCTTYRDHEICGMPAPSSGGIAVAATLGILQNLPMASYRPTDVDLDGGKPTVDGVHYIAEAERLAYADRDKYVADTDFVALPGNSPTTLLNPTYLTERARLISSEKTMGIAKPGEFNVPASAAVSTPEHGTSQVTVVDARGNAASLTTTVESAFGSFHMVDGFMLNNQLTDFAAQPVGKDGLPIANRLQPGKRPRSSMAPTLVFERTASGKRGALLLALGSPGGSVIIQFVVKALVGILDWGLDPQQAVSMVDFGANNSAKTNVGGEHPNIDTRNNGTDDPLIQGLRQRGHTVDVADQSSGLSALVRRGPGWIGGADPRREGLVMGDAG
ncbi:gamma-glutamyltranspeptidase/glutathione hydrolase [Mycobacteroides chelonae]|nr:gamma-glutamyltranspeptidase/glutathione hydrolase [Mycobacteroides chelonae]